jgi:hypothetical protein
MSVGVSVGNIKAMGIVSVTFDPGSVAANTSEEETMTVRGVKVGDFVAVSKPTLEAGLGVCSARVSADNEVKVQLVNPTGSGVNAGSETWLVFWARPEGTVSQVKE